MAVLDNQAANKYKIEGESVKIEVAFGGGFDLWYRTFVVPLNDVLEIREIVLYNYRDTSIKEQDVEVRGQSWSLIDDKNKGVEKTAKPLTQAQKEAVEILERTDGDLNKAGEVLGIDPMSVRSRADEASKKTSRKDYYKLQGSKLAIDYNPTRFFLRT